MLETVFEADNKTVCVVDCMPVDDGGGLEPMRQVVRVVDVIRGEVVLDCPYGYNISEG